VLQLKHLLRQRLHKLSANPFLRKEPSMYLSIVSPVYHAAEIVEKLVSEIHLSAKTITDDYEIILVEDGSPDNSWRKIEAICRIDKKVKGIKLSRNFGQHPAIAASLKASSGEWVVVMDCDLQDRPSEIPNLYAKGLEGFDAVQASRKNRQDSFNKKITSKVYFSVLRYFTDIKFDGTVANFGIFNRDVVDSVCAMQEPIFVFPIMINWIGFKKTTLEVSHSEREEGKSSYNFRRLFELAVNIILANSDKPLWIMMKFGLSIASLAIVLALFILFGYIKGFVTQPGYSSIFLSIWLLGGIIITMIGAVGLYIGKIYEGVKDRPKYIIQKQINN
jgi:polyisoprenyl-phosphate glycosyltransferase